MCRILEHSHKQNPFLIIHLFSLKTRSLSFNFVSQLQMPFIFIPTCKCINNYISPWIERHSIIMTEYGVNKLIFFYRIFSTAGGNSLSDCDTVWFYLTRPISRLFILNLFKIALRNVIFTFWAPLDADDVIKARGISERCSCSNALLNTVMVLFFFTMLRAGNGVILILLVVAVIREIDFSSCYDSVI